MEFELVEAVPSNVDTIADILQLGKAEDSLWKPMMRNVTYENLHTALVGLFRARFDQAGGETFKISEVATGRIIGWTSLLWPKPQTTEQKEEAGQKRAPPAIEGIDPRLVNHFFGRMLPVSKEFGYNPEEHFHKRGTFVHPDFQKRDFGT